MIFFRNKNDINSFFKPKNIKERKIDRKEMINNICIKLKKGRELIRQECKTNNFDGDEIEIKILHALSTLKIRKYKNKISLRVLIDYIMTVNVSINWNNVTDDNRIIVVLHGLINYCYFIELNKFKLLFGKYFE